MRSSTRSVRQGCRCGCRVHGEPYELPPGLDLSGYRILQEGLTNTLKHAHAQQAEVDVRYGATGIQLEVRDDGDGSSPNGDGRSRSRAGRHPERVKIFGGRMTAGASRAGGFMLRALLPLDEGA